MDRRSWLWRRKSSEKSPSGETDSSGSMSSHSERFSDDQGLSNHIIQSPEVTSKSAPSNEELQDSVKTLSDKLSEALLNICAKEELVKQHAKVAEEAVSGWEKAETEVLALKKQVEIMTQKNASLEERVGHLDSALKECLRQLRQAREEQEQKIHEAIAKRICEWESTKSELENQLVVLQSQFETAKTEAVTSTFPDLCIKLEAAEKENSALRLELLTRAKELKLRTTERDLSTSAAETASKQHLEGIKKVAKLEGECRRLKMLVRRAPPTNDNRSVTTSSVYVESFTDSQSDIGERLSVVDNEIYKLGGLDPNDCGPGYSNSLVSAVISEQDQVKSENPLRRNFMGPPDEIDLMDDFLEMERLAALPDAEKGNSPDLGDNGRENFLKAELETMISRTAELEEKLENIEAEKVQLKMVLTKCQDQLDASRDQLEETMVNLVNLKSQLAVANEARRASEAEVEATKIMLKKSMEHLERAEINLVELQNQLALANEAKDLAEIDAKTSNEKLMKSKECAAEAEVDLMELRIQLASTNKAKCNVEAELEATNIKKEATESQLTALEIERLALEVKICNLEEDIQKERTLSAEAVDNWQKLENEISRMKSESQLWKSETFGEFRFNQEKELAVAASKFVECQKTIASLGQQLKSLATLEDFLIDSDTPIEIH